LRGQFVGLRSTGFVCAGHRLTGFVRAGHRLTLARHLSLGDAVRSSRCHMRVGCDQPGSDSYEGFPPNVDANLLTYDATGTERALQTLTIDSQGVGVIEAVIPSYAPIGEVWLYLFVNAACVADTYVIVTE
jgi:hypothetical protein